MKRILILFLILTLTMSVMVSCATPEDNDANNNEGATTNNSGANLVIGDDALKFVVNNVDITPNKEAKPVIEALGEPLDYTESASCGFEDKDRTYKYNGFVIDTVTIKGVEYIYVVQITNDMISTPEGASIGMSTKEIQAAYNGKCKLDGGNVTVAFTNGLLTFFIKNDVCTNITYESTTIPNLGNNE